MQIFPGASVFVHAEPLSANGAVGTSLATITLIFELLELVFLIVTFTGLLVLPSAVLSLKFIELGEIEIVPGSELGEAVGVAVRVAVGVTLAVAVAVGVPLVEVAVGVGVGPHGLPRPSFATKALK